MISPVNDEGRIKKVQFCFIQGIAALQEIAANQTVDVIGVVTNAGNVSRSS